MAAEDISKLIEALTPSQKEAVRQFIAFLKGDSRTKSPFVAAVDEFVAEHPELLRRLGE
jgi:hypothetical protein